MRLRPHSHRSARPPSSRDILLWLRGRRFFRRQVERRFFRRQVERRFFRLQVERRFFRLQVERRFFRRQVERRFFRGLQPRCLCRAQLAGQSW
jgi:hypothetical protein